MQSTLMFIAIQQCGICYTLVQALMRTQLIMGSYSLNTIKAHTNVLSQYKTYYQQLMGLELHDHSSVVSCILHARDVQHTRKKTLLATLQAFKWCRATVWQVGEVDSDRGSELGLLERSIARLADDKANWQCPDLNWKR